MMWNFKPGLCNDSARSSGCTVQDRNMMYEAKVWLSLYTRSYDYHCSLMLILIIRLDWWSLFHLLPRKRDYVKDVCVNGFLFAAQVDLIVAVASEHRQQERLLSILFLQTHFNGLLEWQSLFLRKKKKKTHRFPNVIPPDPDEESARSKQH